MKTKILLLLCTIAIGQAGEVSMAFAESMAKADKKFDFTKKFMGFAYSTKNEELSIKCNQGIVNEKRFVGLNLTFDQEGAIKTITPILDESGDKFDPFAWGIDQFKKHEISLDTFWEIYKTSFTDYLKKSVADQNIPNDAKLFAFLTILKNGSDGFKFEELQIEKNSIMAQSLVDDDLFKQADKITAESAFQFLRKKIYKNGKEEKEK